MTATETLVNWEFKYTITNIMSSTTYTIYLNPVWNESSLTTNESTQADIISRSALNVTSYVTGWLSTSSDDGVLVTSLPKFRTNQTAWACDVNNSEQWQLTYPVCTTRYDSIAVFVIVAAILTFITMWTVMGNVLVLVALYKYKTLRTMSNCLIGNLAISDLLLAITVLPISTTNDLLGYWVFGDFACTVWLCMDVLYCTASVWGLCTVAFDRYMATVYPVWYHDQRSVKKAVGCVVFVWIFSIIISFAPFIGWQHMIPSFFTFNHDINRHECILFMSSSYVIYSSVGSFVIPTCLMTFMYIRIFNVLHQQSKNMKKKIQARQSRRPKVTNGCPTIRVPEAEEDGVVRDMTTTTLVSISVIESSMIYSDDNEQDSSPVEHDRFLQPPRLCLNSCKGPPLSPPDIDLHLEESPKPSKESCLLQNGSSLLLNKSDSNDLPSSNGSVSMDTSFMSFNLTVPDKQSISPRRSNSVCAVPGADSMRSSTNHLAITELERRNSHEGTVNLSGSPKVERPTLLRPVSQRSKSANVLCSSDEEGILHSPHRPRRSLPCDLRKLGRNKKMTLSMKRRFELREQRATKRMLLIMACFCVCWVPFVAMYITRSLCHDCYMNIHLVAATIWLGYVNSSLNPVLYSLFNDDFKCAFKKLIGIKSSPPPGGRR